MREIGRFDGHDGGQFVEPPKDFKSMNHIQELRWRAEQGFFGPKPLSAPRGELLFRLSDQEIKNYAMKQADSSLPADQKIRQHLAANGDY